MEIEKVLIIDDDESFGWLVDKILRREGFSTSWASSGDEAIKLLKEVPDCLLLLDYELGDMTGISLIEYLHEAGCNVPFILMTACGSEKVATEVMRLGASDYLAKDDDFKETLPRVVKRVITQINTARELSRAEARLTESERRFRSISELFPFPVWICTVGGETEYLNPQFTRLFGYTIEDVPSIWDWFELASPAGSGRKNASDEWKVNDSSFAAGEEVKRKLDVICKDGTAKIVTVRFLQMEDGKSYMVFHDITESEQMRKKLQEMNDELQTTLDELQSSQSQLLQATKLAAIGELVSGVAHELNNPLSAISMHSELLEGKVEDENSRNHLEIINSQVERAIAIVKNLLSFARNHEPAKEAVSINDAVQSSVALRAYDLNLDDIKVTLELDADLPMVMADLHQLQQVFLNLTNNAAQSMRDAHGKGELVIQSKMAGEMIQVSFSDDGAGIFDDKLEKIFDPFFTTKDVGKGTGLGLSICYGIIEEHGGCIRVESKLGEGAKFTVELPVVHESITVE